MAGELSLEAQPPLRAYRQQQQASTGLLFDSRWALGKGHDEQQAGFLKSSPNAAPEGFRRHWSVASFREDQGKVVAPGRAQDC